MLLPFSFQVLQSVIHIGPIFADDMDCHLTLLLPWSNRTEGVAGHFECHRVTASNANE